MPLFEWSEKFSVNIAACDEQHKCLIELLNTLHAAMKQGKGRDVISGVLNELADYTVYHFKTEEDLFRKHGYHGFDNHKKEHDDLTNQVMGFKNKFEQGQAALTIELMKFLKDWLTDHILESDNNYSLFLNSKGVV